MVDWQTNFVVGRSVSAIKNKHDKYNAEYISEIFKTFDKGVGEVSSVAVYCCTAGSGQQWAAVLHAGSGQQ